MKYANNILHDKMIVSDGIPKVFRNLADYDKLDSETHYNDGWREIEEPIVEQNQLAVKLRFDYEKDKFVYSIIDKPQTILESELMAQAETKRAELLKAKVEEKIIAEAQTTMNDEDALASQSLFPFWEVGVYVEEKHKYQRIVGTEILLYKVNDGQSHTTQDDWKPESTPALFTRVGFEGEILVFVQPTGTQDAYMKDAIVWFPTLNSTKYKSKIDNNVWSPTAYPQGWEIVA